MLEVVGDFLHRYTASLLKSVTCLLELTQLNREGIGQLKKTKNKLKIKERSNKNGGDLYYIIWREFSEKKFQCVFYQTMRKHNT